MFSILRHIRPRPMPLWPSVANQDGGILTYFDGPWKIEDLTKSKKFLRQITPKSKLHHFGEKKFWCFRPKQWLLAVSSNKLLRQRVFCFCKLKKIPQHEPLPYLARLVPYLSPAVIWEKRRPRPFRFLLQRFIWFLSTLWDQEQSSSNEILWVRCAHHSPAHV